MLITAQGFSTLLLSISTIVSNDLFLTDVDGDLLRNIGFVQFQPLNQLLIRFNHLLFKWLFPVYSTEVVSMRCYQFSSFLALPIIIYL